MDKNVNPTFATEQAPTEPTELERVQQRIANYKIAIAPSSAQAISTLLQLHLKSGQIKIDELDAVIGVRNEINKGLTDYNIAVETAQRQLNSLVEADRIAKAEAIEKEKAELVDKIRDQRKLRKAEEIKVAQLEAILASHGVNVDLNGDGVIGVKAGDLNADGFVELTKEEAATLAADHGVTIPPQTIQKGTRTEAPKKTSKAFEMARLLNPEGESNTQPPVTNVSVAPISEDEGFNNYVEEAKDSVNTWEEQTETEVPQEEMLFGSDESEEDGFDLPIEDETITIELPVPEDAKGIEAFLEEVESVKHEAEIDDIDEEQFNQSFEDTAEQEGKEIYSGAWSSGEDTMPDIKVAEEDTKTEPTYAKPSAVPITSTNMPRQTLKSGDSIEAEVKEQKINTYDSEEEMLEAVQQKIDTAKEQEEEFDEITIPSADELKGMTKSKIKEVAEGLNFEVSTTDTKDAMIESIATQTESLIESLQETDEFVSATETVKGEDDDDRRDGGYF
jgi:hypothetical protein